MLVFFLKQLFSLKRAILGRREPHQLAAGLALGVLLGIVPHGNLIALAIFLFILSVRVNHGMVAITAVATTLFAATLDAQTHLVGKYVLTHPDLAHQLAAAWQWPMVPWTDLNNTIVMGGLLVGLAALLPAYLFSYPIFHYLAPPANDLPVADADPPPTSGGIAAVRGSEAENATGSRLELPAGDTPIAVPAGDTPVSVRPISVRPGDTPVSELPAGDTPAAVPAGDTPAAERERVDTIAIFHPLGEVAPVAVDAAFGDVTRAEQAARQVTIDTRIEVVRISDTPTADHATTRGPAELAELQQTANETSQQDQPMSEALNYLLRQLRDSRQGRAA